MATISERAVEQAQKRKALADDMRVDHNDADHARETWRVLAEELADADADLENMDRRRTVLRDSISLRFQSQGVAKQKADQMANTAGEYQTYLEAMDTVTRRVRRLRVAVENADRLYWRANNRGADRRSEMRMAR